MAALLLELVLETVVQRLVVCKTVVFERLVSACPVVSALLPYVSLASKSGWPFVPLRAATHVSVFVWAVKTASLEFLAGSVLVSAIVLLDVFAAVALGFLVVPLVAAIPSGTAHPSDLVLVPVSFHQ